MNITFWGATDEVTGSMTFLTLDAGTVLIDAGLSQGHENSSKKNRVQLPYSPQEIHAVFITHAHLDHSGYLPRLVKNGFRGTIYCTPATAKLMRIILNDSASLTEDDYYRSSDVQTTMQLIRTVDWNHEFTETGAVFEFIPAGHILGASSLIVTSDGKRILFSGDLGRQGDFLIAPPAPAPKVDVVIMESTYGAKRRSGDPSQELGQFLEKVQREKKVGIVASFAMARAQMLLTIIQDYFEKHPERRIPVYMDSPMMKEVNQVYKTFSHHTLRSSDLFEALENVEPIDFPRQWEALKKKDGPMVILASSGMLTGGRIWRHLSNWQNERNCTLLLPGHQGDGTPGKALAQGNRYIKNDDDEVVHWSGEVIHSEAFSSHADQAELMDWLSQTNRNCSVFLIHGEDDAKKALAAKLEEKDFEVTLPKRGDNYHV